MTAGLAHRGGCCAKNQRRVLVYRGLGKVRTGGFWKSYPRATSRGNLAPLSWRVDSWGTSRGPTTAKIVMNIYTFWSAENDVYTFG